MQPSAVDANLFVILDALLEERSVVRAARRVALSPSATSHALGRLRRILGDELLVRAGDGLELTPRGQALVQPSRRMMLELAGMLDAASPFDPRELRRTFRIAASDHTLFVLMRPLEHALSRKAPHVDLHFLPLSNRSTTELEESTADLALGVFDRLPPKVSHASLFNDKLVPMVRAGHPALKKTLTLRAFARMDHVLVAPYGSLGGPVDDVLAKRGLTRRVARVFPAFFEAPFLVAHTDYVVTLPLALARPLADLVGLARLRVAVPFPRFQVSMAWHRRLDGDTAHTWLRSLIDKVARELSRTSLTASSRGSRQLAKRAQRSPPDRR
jgi:DNA-binding transcriptional LysR family regulator